MSGRKIQVCIVGAGAIGGFVGTRLAAAGRCDVHALARGETLAALNAHGWRLWQDGQLLQAPARAVATAAELGPQDLVVVAVKTPSLAAVAPAVAALTGPQTVVLPLMNGVPWWFGAGLDALGDAPLDSVDAGGAISATIAMSQVVGGVVHASAVSPEPGLVRHAMGRGLIVGEPVGGPSARVDALAQTLGHAGFEATASPQIRRDVWYKLWGNLTINPISVLTGATADRVLDDPLLRAYCTAAMGEAAAIGARIGCYITQSAEDRHAVTRKLGALRTSMLHDAEAGRPLEIDSIVAAVVEIGRRVQVPTPNIDALLGLTRLYARVRGLYPPAVA